MTMLCILNRNADSIKETISENLLMTSDPILKRLDRICFWFFIFAILCSIAFGILRAMA
jgi:hypothetical protein